MFLGLFLWLLFLFWIFFSYSALFAFGLSDFVLLFLLRNNNFKRDRKGADLDGDGDGSS